MNNKISKTAPLCGIFLFLLALGILASPLLAGERRPGGPHRPPGARPPEHNRPRPPHYDPSYHIWVDIDEDEDDNRDPNYPIQHPPQADGTVSVVPISRSAWEKHVDVGTNSFTFGAPLTLPQIVKSPDVALIRAIFNEAVDRKSVDVAVNADFTHLMTSGSVASGHTLNEVELVQIVVERQDGKTFVQHIAVGL